MSVRKAAHLPLARRRLELQLGEVERCRALYSKYLQWSSWFEMTSMSTVPRVTPYII